MTSHRSSASTSSELRDVSPQSQSPDDRPAIHIIAGPNGAGKTTFAEQYLPSLANCFEFLNADLIAAGLSPYSPDQQNLRAGSLMLERMRELVAKRTTFAFETTLSGRSYLRMIPLWRTAGYQVRIYFLYLPSAEIAVSRVRVRVEQGGHQIPETDIRRRYVRGLENFFRRYHSIVDTWRLYDSSSMPPRLIAMCLQGQISFVDGDRFRAIRQAADSPE
ncbi:MAG: zeta toxin family protein [Planctomycetaceae bacterium]